MSWTDVDTLKTHLQAFSADALSVRFRSLRLAGSDPVQLPHSLLVAGSVTVHGCLAVSPTGPETVTLNGTAWHTLGHAPVRPDSVVLAPDALPSARYAEGVDYAVDEENGRVKRLPGGTILDGAAVRAWYLPLTAYTEDVDYEVDATAGTLARLPTGSLPDPAHVLVSYRTLAVDAGDPLLAQAVGEAQTKITDRLREDYTSASTDAGLTIGATELALAIVCDDLALRTLTAVGDASADDRSQRFMELARRYEQRAGWTLSRFLRAPLPSGAVTQPNRPASGW